MFPNNEPAELSPQTIYVQSNLFRHSELHSYENNFGIRLAYYYNLLQTAYEYQNTFPRYFTSAHTSHIRNA